MRTVRVDKNRTIEVPTTWAEGERMLSAPTDAPCPPRAIGIQSMAVLAKPRISCANGRPTPTPRWSGPRNPCRGRAPSSRL